MMILKVIKRVIASAVKKIERIASPEDIAGVVVFPASDSARFLSRTAINVDAGKSIGVW